LRKYLLRNVFHVVALAHDAVDDRKNFGLIALDDFTERRLVAGLGPVYEGTFRGVLIVHSGFRRNLATEPGKRQSTGYRSHTPVPTRTADCRFQLRSGFQLQDSTDP